MSKTPKSPTGDSLSALAEALRRFKPLLAERDFELLLAELRQPLMQALRVNTLKVADPAAAIARWSELYRWEVQPIAYCQTGWQVAQAKVPISQPIEHRLGYYYIQDAASMLPVSLFRLQPDERSLILDMAASPGGKTTHLVDRSGDLGFVVANDSGRERITMLRLVLQDWGALNTAVTRFPAEEFGQWYPDTFDLVLLDAPCSMQNLRSSEARPMHSISMHELQALSSRQQKMLWSALQAVRPGGQVVYSTCSLDPQEDEAVLDAVLKRAGGAIQIEAVDDRIPVPAGGLSITQEGDVPKAFHAQVKNAVRLWPHLLKTSGFFAALITKQEPLAVEKKNPPMVSTPTSLVMLKEREARRVIDRLLQAYGFDFSPLKESHRLELWQRKNALYAIPQAWWEHFNQLPFQAVGMRIGEFADGFIPSHEWVGRFADQFQQGIYTISNEQAASWMRGQDVPLHMPTSAAGDIVAVRDELGRQYGRGKLSSTRLRNLLPRRLVLPG